ncbi:hypothetical protein LCGC14_1963400 [marine sediment metagenome]|uniref:Uncharacterized protein n=1 Tax=marine sediment metagenome TaxID=412755 RepID=A0A0F9HS92_9ZZZZ
MMRKEVIVADKVFDLGLKGLEEATESCQRVHQEYELEVEGTVFQVGVSRQERAIILHWTGLTVLSNIVWMRFVVLRPRRPFVKTLSCFTYF